MPEQKSAKPKGAPRAAGRRKTKFASAYLRAKYKKEGRKAKRADKMERLADKRKAMTATVKTEGDGVRTISAFSTGLTMARFRSRYVDKVDKAIRRKILTESDADPIHVSTNGEAIA